MRYTIDTEFDGHGGPLISVALVKQDGTGFYGSTHHTPADPWVRNNVIPQIDDIPHSRVIGYLGDEAGLREAVQRYLKRDPEDVVFISDSPVDVARVANILSTGRDGGWQSCGLPHITFEVRNVDCWPNNLGPDAVQHNAYWDALALWEKINAR